MLLVLVGAVKLIVALVLPAVADTLVGAVVVPATVMENVAAAQLPNTLRAQIL
jgi:hypothetical protein